MEFLTLLNMELVVVGGSKDYFRTRNSAKPASSPKDLALLGVNRSAKVMKSVTSVSIFFRMLPCIFFLSAFTYYFILSFVVIWISITLP